MKKLLIPFLIISILIFAPAFANADNNEVKPVDKASLGKMLALYPSVATVIGAEVDGRVNWLLVTHTGIMAHNRILVSMSK